MGLEILIIFLNPLTIITIAYAIKKLQKTQQTEQREQPTTIKQILAQPQQTKEKTWTCEYCKTKNTENTLLCTKCGAPQWNTAK